MITPSKAELRLLRELGFKRGRQGWSAERWVNEHDVWAQLVCRGTDNDASRREWQVRRIPIGAPTSKCYTNHTLGGALAMGELNGWA